MKAQFDVDDDLWRVIRVDALRQGKTMGEVIEPVLRKRWGGSAVSLGGDDEVRVHPPKLKQEPSTFEITPKPDQKTCKHSFAMKPAGGSKCVKCGWEP